MQTQVRTAFMVNRYQGKNAGVVFLHNLQHALALEVIEIIYLDVSETIMNLLHELLLSLSWTMQGLVT